MSNNDPDEICGNCVHYAKEQYGVCKKYAPRGGEGRTWRHVHVQEWCSEFDMKDSPKFFYRYYRFDEHTEKIFTKNEIYFQKPSKFDDPLDSIVKFVLKGTEIKKQSFFKRNLPIVEPEFTEQQVNEIFKNPSKREKVINDSCEMQKVGRDELGIYCLTTLRDNILMWTHYSDNHKGFCLEFDGQSEFFQRALPVKYSKVMPTRNIVDRTIGESHTSAEHAKLAELLLTKAEDWEYQDERRIVYTPEHGGPGPHTFPEKLLTGVILGFQISNKNRNHIIEWCRDRKFEPKIYQTKLKDIEFGLDVIPIEMNTI